MNAKTEFLELIGTKKVKCAEINYVRDGWRIREDYVRDGWRIREERERLNTEHSLKVGYSPQELIEFLDSLDFDYDDGYGTQELFGTVWFEMREWAERCEDEGHEWWEIKSYPQIPKNLKIK